MTKLLAMTLGLTLLAAGCATVAPVTREAAGDFEIVHTKFLGCLWNAAHARASIVSQDGGESFTVPGGAIWAYGDTFKGSRGADGSPQFAGGAFAPAIALLPARAAAYPPAFQFLVSSNGGVPAIDFLPTEQPRERYRIWPLGGVYWHGKAYLYYSLIEVFGNGAWDFRGVGAGLARATDGPLGFYARLQPHGNWRYPVEPTQVLAADSWLYLYGIASFANKQGVTLARVRPEQIEEPAAYEFYAGAGPIFSTNAAEAVCLVSNVPGQVAVAWNAYLQKYIMASSSDFSHPREIRLLEADTPAGPWSGPVARIEVPARRQGKAVNMVYCAYLHPELFRDGGRVMNLTFSLDLKNGGFDANCEMVEVTVKKRLKDRG